MAQIPLLFYTIIQKFVVGKIFLVFWILTKAAFKKRKRKKNSNIVKYYYELKNCFPF